MAVLKKFPQSGGQITGVRQSSEPMPTSHWFRPVDARYEPAAAQRRPDDECWLLDQRCFVDGEAYSR